jgi:hypothetical protein
VEPCGAVNGADDGSGVACDVGWELIDVAPTGIDECGDARADRCPMRVAGTFMTGDVVQHLYRLGECPRTACLAGHGCRSSLSNRLLRRPDQPSPLAGRRLENLPDLER